MKTWHRLAYFIHLFRELDIVYKYPLLSKSSLTSLHFYGRPILVSVFNDLKKSEQDFHFHKKRSKAKATSALDLQGAPVKAARAPSSHRGTTHSSPGATLSCSASSCRGLALCLGACVLCLCCVHPLARRVLRYPESLREVLFGVWER